MTDAFTGRPVRIKKAPSEDGIMRPVGSFWHCGAQPVRAPEFDVHTARVALLEEMLQYAKRNAYMYGEHAREVGRLLVADQFGVQIAMSTLEVWQAMVTSACSEEL